EARRDRGRTAERLSKRSASRQSGTRPYATNVEQEAVSGSGRRGEGVMRGQAVADAELGQKDARLGRVLLDFLPQLAHEDAQIMGVMHVRRSPHLLEEILVGHDIAGVLGEDLQKPVFLRRQRDLAAVE